VPAAHQVAERVALGVPAIGAVALGGKLIPGVGRNGEPLYLMAQYHKLPAVPLKTPKFAPSGATKLKKEPVKALQFDKPKAGAGGGPGGGGAGGGGHQGGGKTTGGTGGG